MSSDIDDDGDYSSIDSRDPKMDVKNGLSPKANGIQKSDLLMRYNNPLEEVNLLVTGAESIYKC